MKKVLYGILGFIGLLVVLAIAIPLFIDVDKYRPQILSKANEQLNGKLDLGHLKLNLWGAVNVQIDGLKLADAKGIPVLEVRDASLNIPFLSFLSGSPEVRLQLRQPNIRVVKGRDGKLNVMTLVKSAPSSAGGAAGATTPDSSAAGPQKSTQATAMPAFLLTARLTFLIEQANVAYTDELTGDAYKIHDLRFTLRDVSPSRPMPFELVADLDISSQKTTTIKGPLVFKGVVTPEASQAAFEKMAFDLSASLEGAEVRSGSAFGKKKGVPLGFSIKGHLGKEDFAASELHFQLADVKVSGSLSGKTSAEKTTINLKASSNQIDVAKLAGLSPMVEEYGANGQLELNVQAQGPTDSLSYLANVKFSKVVLKNPALKQPLNIDGSIAVATNELREMQLNVTAKDFDLKLAGALQNFAAPKFKFKLNSSKMDLDNLLVASEKAAEARAERADKAVSNPSAAPATTAAPVVDYNAMLEPLRKNPVAAASAGTFDFDLKWMKSTGVVIQDLRGQFAMNNLLLALNDFSMRIFDGSIKGKMSLNAKAAKPDTAINFEVANLQTQKMMESKMPFARNTVKGEINGSLNLGGAGLNTPDITSVWRGSGALEIRNAVFSTLDFGKQLKEGVINKLPDLVKSKVKLSDKLVDRQGEYETVLMKFSMVPGTMNITEVTGRAVPNRGLDIKGGGAVKLADYGLDMRLDLIDTYNVFGLDKEAPEPKYNHFAVPAHVVNTLFSPKMDWGDTVGKLAANAARAQLKQRGSQALGGVLNKVMGGNSGGASNGGSAPVAPPKPAEAVKALKGLFGH